MVAKAVMTAEGIKTAIDIAVPETALDVIRWHSEASRKYGELKMALGGIDASLNINVLSDGSNGPAVVVAQFSTEGTRLGNAGVEALHPNPSLANTSSTHRGAPLLREGLVRQLAARRNTHVERQAVSAVACELEESSGPVVRQVSSRRASLAIPAARGNAAGRGAGRPRLTTVRSEATILRFMDLGLKADGSF